MRPSAASWIPTVAGFCSVTMIPWMLLESHYDAKPLFPIIAGIVGIRSEWNDGLDSRHFRQTINQLLGKADPHLGLCNGGLSL